MFTKNALKAFLELNGFDRQGFLHGVVNYYAIYKTNKSHDGYCIDVLVYQDRVIVKSWWQKPQNTEFSPLDGDYSPVKEHIITLMQGEEPSWFMPEPPSPPTRGFQCPQF